MADEKKYVGSDAALPRLWERVKALVSHKANVITSGKMLSYSTEEQVVGRWIDGKPLYQKTIEITTVSGTNKIDATDWNIDMFVNAEICVNHKDSVIVPLPYSRSTTDFTQVVYRPNAKEIDYYCGTESPFGVSRFTFRYTKTTDTAESEVFDPVAFINKPNLWEPGKEYDFGDGVYGQRWTGDISNNQSLTVSTISNLKYVISHEAYIKRKNNGPTFFIQHADTAFKNNLNLVINNGNIMIQDYNLIGGDGATYYLWLLYTKTS